MHLMYLTKFYIFRKLIIFLYLFKVKQIVNVLVKEDVIVALKAINYSPLMHNLNVLKLKQTKFANNIHLIVMEIT